MPHASQAGKSSAIAPYKLPPYSYEVEVEQQLPHWATSVNAQLRGLSSLLAGCRDLRGITLEASSDSEVSVGPRWDYLLASPMSTLVSTLPKTIVTLTLDTCGSSFATTSEDGIASHFCALIAERLDGIQHVRLRMRHICPKIFPSQSYLPTTASMLKTMVIKLSLPMFPQVICEVHDGYKQCDACLCGTEDAPAYREMVNAALDFASSRPMLDLLCISYRSPLYSGINIEAVDCIHQRYLYDPSEIFIYQDDGTEWIAWEEDDENLRVFTAPKYNGALLDLYQRRSG